MNATAETDPYGKLVRRYFEKPVHAGRLDDEYDEAVVAVASESAKGVRVVLSAVAEGQSIRRMRYSVFGCPHLIAAAEAFCEATEGRPVSALADLDVPGLMKRLSVPVEKTGRVFILEDAAKALHIKLTSTTDINPDYS